MKTKTIKIGNMYGSRCITDVKEVLDTLKIKHTEVELGFSKILPTKKTDYKKLEEELKKVGYELIHSKEEVICEKIKIAIHKLFMEAKIDLKGFNLRVYLENEIPLPYKKQSEIFSTYNHKTIETYFILNRIEKVKMMIDDTEFSFSEIAFKLGYNSLSHLSRQFKAVEKISMSDYKKKPKKKRKLIDEI